MTQNIRLQQLRDAAIEQMPIELSASGLTVKIFDIVVQNRVSFLDYVFGGTEIGLQIAIDFTASNGDPRKPESLHYMNGSSPNQYLQAIRAAGNILEQYDSDKLYPVYGFGAKNVTANSNTTSHCFALNGNIFDPEVQGIDGVVTAYQNAIRRV